METQRLPQGQIQQPIQQPACIQTQIQMGTGFKSHNNDPGHITLLTVANIHAHSRYIYNILQYTYIYGVHAHSLDVAGLVQGCAGVCCWGRERALAFSGGFSCVSITVTDAFRPSGHHQCKKQIYIHMYNVHAHSLDAAGLVQGCAVLRGTHLQRFKFKPCSGFKPSESGDHSLFSKPQVSATSSAVGSIASRSTAD